MSQDTYKDQILGLLAKEWDLTGPPGLLDIDDIVAALPLAPGDVLYSLLYDNGQNQARSLSPPADPFSRLALLRFIFNTIAFFNLGLFFTILG